MTRSIETAWADLERLAKESAADLDSWEAATFDEETDAYLITASGMRAIRQMAAVVAALASIAAANPATALELIAAARANSVGIGGADAPKPFDPAVAGELVEALRRIRDLDTRSHHDGYDNGPGGGNYIYRDVIFTDEAFPIIDAALAKYATQQGIVTPTEGEGA